MKRAAINDIPRLVEILTESFKENKSVNYVLKNKISLSKLFYYSIEKGFLYGDIWMNEDKTACAILINPKKKKIKIKSIWLDLKLIFQVVGLSNVKKVLHKENITEETLPKNKDYIHLWFLGVSPKEQGKGKGNKLLKEMIDYYKSFKEAMYLETSTLKNLPFYEKVGFKIYEKKDFGFTLYFLEKKLFRDKTF